MDFGSDYISSWSHQLSVLLVCYVISNNQSAGHVDNVFSQILDFNNGGFLKFEDCEDFNKKGEFFYCYNEKNNETWYFKYYGEKIN